jgi:hypothetical protein
MKSHICDPNVALTIQSQSMRHEKPSNLRPFTFRANIKKNEHSIKNSHISSPRVYDVSSISIHDYDRIRWNDFIFSSIELII